MRHIPLVLLTYRKPLFDIIRKGSRTSKKHMMLEISLARQGYKRIEIINIGFFRRSKNIADGLIKAMQQAAILDIMRTGRLYTETEQLVIREA